MGKKAAVEEGKKKKKKGRPSLLDLQKRNLLQQEQQQLQKPKHRNPNSSPAPSSRVHDSSLLRRSARRSNPAASAQADNDGHDQLGPAKKPKLTDANSLDTGPADSGSGGDSSPAANHKKRKINAIPSRSGIPLSQKSDKSTSDANQADDVQESVPCTPLPDKKLLFFILERLQSKDTYGAFSEPVDTEELPDYHELIDNPMDFRTVTEKLTEGVYASLEQFEKDIFLICSNAMEYNAPDTIYFRQARAIEELAKKNFENLRQDSDDNEPATHKVAARRGRPPTKNVKKKPGRPAQGQRASELSSINTTSSTADKEGAIRLNSADLRNFGFSNGSGNDAGENKLLDRNNEATGFFLRGNSNSLKNGKKLLVLDENRRDTYMQFLESTNGREPSVLATFHSERRQLVAVGLLTEYGYGRSLARFAANAGPVVWRIASAKIQRSLPPGVQFGPGWVGENDIPQRRPVFPFPSSSSVLPSPLKPCSPLPASGSVSEGDNSLEKLPEDNGPSVLEDPSGNSELPSRSASASHLSGSKSESQIRSAEAIDELNHNHGLNTPNGGSMDVITNETPPVEAHESQVIHPGMNGLNGKHVLQPAPDNCSNAENQKHVSPATPESRDETIEQKVELDSSTQQQKTEFHQPGL
ncbi:unnamed protein product [Linum trigynum]|uniref:Bromo domain-containing protein n=1 Tax=Linum trigynum TaxID=586398 RepID=A0AAV2FM17_9ROSI